MTTSPQQLPVSFRPVSYTPRTEKQQRQHTSSSASPERPNIPMERRSTVHFDDEPAPNEAPNPSIPVVDTKPAQASLEVYDTNELTAVDKKWGRLFEIDNQPTERFREAMHSLSRYIVCGGLFSCVVLVLEVKYSHTSFRSAHSRLLRTLFSCPPNLLRFTISMASTATRFPTNVSIHF